MPHQEIRFGDFVREISVQQSLVSSNDLAPKPRFDAEGREIPYEPPKVELGVVDAWRILKPYVSVRFSEQVRAVLPLGAYLALFQLLLLRQNVADAWLIAGGFALVILGLMFFMEGLKLGIMPFGEELGNTLPKKSPLWVVLIIAFLLGVGVTYAEPAIGALKQAGSLVSVEQAPLLFALLNQWSDTLVLVMGAGVGVAAVLGTLRFIYGWSLKPLIYLTLLPTIALTVYCMTVPELNKAIGIAWDCGGSTTGPVTVPLVLALGIGVAAAAGRDDASLSGFGIVTLASVIPVLATLILVVYVAHTSEAEAIIAAARTSAEVAATAPHRWWEVSPGLDIALGVRAIVPLVVFLLVIMKLILRQRVRDAGIIAYGILLSVLGMCLFNIGLTYGLARLGEQSGALVPAAFAQISEVLGSPLYAYALGVPIALGFAFFLGFGATLAEPALSALGLTVENLSNGAFRRSMLSYSVSVGVGVGIALGVAKILFDLPLGHLLTGSYALAVLFTFFSAENFVDIAWDSAGVTTGPVTVPLVLSMGIGFGSAVRAVEGFGILALASVWPIITVLGAGLYAQLRARRAARVPAAVNIEGMGVRIT